ncbi:MAG TPA: sigma 54-interacting transcriptional regulator [Kofleriaceae bacterium]|nr:sigma 54-interacting transcriptional regulator [Kofleriaceae bacterium]
MSDSTTKSTRRVSSDPSGERWLVVSSAAGLATMRLPPRPEIVIGRAPDCDVVVDDPSVSRRHASLDASGSVRDLGSRNGTTVAGKRLARGESAPLGVGGVAEIGSATIVLVASRPVRSGRTAAPLEEAIAHDPTMRHLYGLLELVGPSDLPVLILGETGAGKEVFAEAIHRRSRRAQATFLRINCAGLTGSLLESELFGYERGAFTGAVAARPGLFEAAHGGTMFLDEVGELPQDTQAKLLRVLDSGEVYRLGSHTPRRIDVRYVAATNRDLEEAVDAGTFRQDLFFRLNGFALTLPPLRRRLADIVPLAELFLERCAARAGVPAPRLHDEAARALVAHPFPGNVRELKHMIDRAFVLARGGAELTPEHLSISDVVRPRSRALDIDRDAIAAALRRTNGNQRRAAELLGIARRTLINRMEEFGMDRPRKKSGPPKA